MRHKLEPLCKTDHCWQPPVLIRGKGPSRIFKLKKGKEVRIVSAFPTDYGEYCFFCTAKLKGEFESEGGKLEKEFYSNLKGGSDGDEFNIW